MNTKLIGFIILGVILIGVTVWQLVDFRASEGPEIPAPTKIQAPTGAPGSTAPTSETPTTGTGQVVAAVTKITIEGDEFRFAPADISVTRGATVELTFKNIGRAPHNYIVTELGLATKTISGGKTDVVTFVVPNTPGTISYASFCSVPGHKEAGMVGTIEVK